MGRAAKSNRLGKPEHLLGGRSVAYTHFKAIDLNLDTIFDRMKRLKAIRLSQRKQSIADYVASLWWVHPFREGNTRMHTTYFALLSKSIGYSFDWATYAETLKAENIRDYFVLYTLDGEPRQRYYERLTSFLS